MQTRLAAAAALLTSGLLAGAFLYGRFVVVPTFAGVPPDVHLTFRVELMEVNKVVMPALMGCVIATTTWLAIGLRGRARAVAVAAAALALTSLLVTRYGNVPINLEIKQWARGALTADHIDRLRTWDTFNDVRVAAAVAAFVLVLLAADQAGLSARHASVVRTAGPTRAAADPVVRSRDGTTSSTLAQKFRDRRGIAERP